MKVTYLIEYGGEKFSVRFWYTTEAGIMAAVSEAIIDMGSTPVSRNPVTYLRIAEDKTP